LDPTPDEVAMEFNGRALADLPDPKDRTFSITRGEYGAPCCVV
jgi:formate dehydrogenase major subunit